MAEQLKPGTVEQHLATIKLKEWADENPIGLVISLVMHCGIDMDTSFELMQGIRENEDLQELLARLHLPR